VIAVTVGKSLLLTSVTRYINVGATYTNLIWRDNMNCAEMKIFTVQWQPKRFWNQEGALIEQSFEGTSATEVVFQWINEHKFFQGDVLQFQVCEGETIENNLVYKEIKL